MSNPEPPAEQDAFTELWPSGLPADHPGDGFLPGAYQLHKAWDAYEQATKRTRVRQANRIHVYASQMMGAVKV